MPDEKQPDTNLQKQEPVKDDDPSVEIFWSEGDTISMRLSACGFDNRNRNEFFRGIITLTFAECVRLSGEIDDALLDARNEAQNAIDKISGMQLE